MTLSGDEGKFIIVKYASNKQTKKLTRQQKENLPFVMQKNEEEKVVKNLMRKLTKKVHTHVGGGGPTKVETSHKQSM